MNRLTWGGLCKALAQSRSRVTDQAPVCVVVQTHTGQCKTVYADLKRDTRGHPYFASTTGRRMSWRGLYRALQKHCGSDFSHEHIYIILPTHGWRSCRRYLNVKRNSNGCPYFVTI